MNQNTPEYYWQEPRICATCTHYYENLTDPIQPGRPECSAGDCTKGPHHRACTRYSPKPVKDTI